MPIIRQSSLPSKSNSSDHGPTIIIATAIMLGTTVMALAMRLHQRWPWSRMFRLEDFLLVSALVLEIATVAAIALAVQYGLGQRSSDLTKDQVDHVKQALVATFALTFLTEGLSAMSSVALLRSMDPHKEYQRFTLGLLAVACAWSLAGTARFAAASSSASETLDRSNWIVFAVISILIQITLFAAAMWTIWPLQMSISKKLGCSLWLSLCLPVAAVTIIRLVYTPTQTFGPNFTWEDTYMVIISVIESNLAIISAAYPSLRSFMNKVSTGFLVPGTTKDSKSGSKGGSFGVKAGGYGMHTLSSVAMRKPSTRPREPGMSLGDQTAGQHTATVRGDTRSDKSFGSEAIMVRRSVEIDEISVPDS